MPCFNHLTEEKRKLIGMAVHSVLDSRLGVIMYFNFWDPLRSRFKYLVSQMRCVLYCMFVCTGMSCFAFWWFLPYFNSPPSHPCPASKKIMTLWRLRWWLAFILFYFIILATPCNLWDLSSLTRDWTHAPCSGSAQNPSHRTTREVPAFFSNEVFLN